MKPLREGDAGLLARYDAVLDPTVVRMVDLTAPIIDRAAHLRATHNFRTPDALHLATAIEVGASVFFTGDATLAKCPDLVVDVIAP